MQRRRTGAFDVRHPVSHWPAPALARLRQHVGAHAVPLSAACSPSWLAGARWRRRWLRSLHESPLSGRVELSYARFRVMPLMQLSNTG